MKQKSRRLIHKIFHITLLVKAFDGILEFLSGFFLFFISSAGLVNLIQKIFQHELTQDPTDILANSLLNFFHTSVNAKLFAAVYLFVHGFVKLWVVYGLWSRNTKTYPIAGVVLALLIAYQLSKVFATNSLILTLLTILDIFIFVLMVIDYKNKRN